MLINEDALALPALLLAVHDTLPVSCSCIPSTISELERVSTMNRPDVFSGRSFRNHDTSGVGNPRTGHTRRTINPSTTRKSRPILTTASSIPSRPITRPVDTSICGFSPAMTKNKSNKNWHAVSDRGYDKYWPHSTVLWTTCQKHPISFQKLKDNNFLQNSCPASIVASISRESRAFWSIRPSPKSHRRVVNLVRFSINMMHLFYSVEECLIPFKENQSNPYYRGEKRV